MEAKLASGSSWGSGELLDDGPGGWAWVRAHRLYCTAVLAIIAATLVGASWAGQPSGPMSTTSSSSSASVTVPAAASR